VTDSGTLAVNNVSVAIDFLAVALSNLTSSELADEVTLAVNNVALTVDLEALARVVFLLLLFRLVSLCLTDGVTVGVNDITVLVDIVVLERGSITLDEFTADLTVGTKNGTVLLDLAGQERGEWTFLLTTTLGLREELCTTNDVSTVIPDLSVPVTDLANESSWVTLNDDTVDGAVLVDELAGLVDTLTCELRAVNLLLGLRVGLFPALSVAEDVTHAVNDITLWVDLLAGQLLGLTVSDLTDLLAVRDNVTVLLDNGIRVILKWTRLLDAALVRWDWLSVTDDNTC